MRKVFSTIFLQLRQILSENMQNSELQNMANK